VTHGPGGARILIVEDDDATRRALARDLGLHGYHVEEAEDGHAAIGRWELRRPDLVLVDLGLPDMDGLRLVRLIRRDAATPVIVLSARGEERTKIDALEQGADDYVTKPFGVEELMARLRAALRHRLQEQGGRPVFHSGDLSVDLVKRIVTVRGQEIKLSPKEYDILQQFVLHAGKVLTHRHLLREVWGIDSGGDLQYLRVYIRQLRQKLEKDPEQPVHILTEAGVGYRLHYEN
jgi:two-component system KDP operon response regulator KdpE